MTNVSNRRAARASSLFKKEGAAAPGAAEVLSAVLAPAPVIETARAAPAADLRPKMREDDPRERAAQRARELREHHGDMTDGTDDFYVDIDSIPDGWTYEWKRHSTYGVEDPAYQIQLARSGWTPVPLSRHPEMMPYGSAQDTILRKGMMLMECPTEIVEERRLDEKRRARDQVRHKESQIAGTPDGTMTREDARVRPKISKSYEAMPIPKE